MSRVEPLESAVEKEFFNFRNGISGISVQKFKVRTFDFHIVYLLNAFENLLQ